MTADDRDKAAAKTTPENDKRLPLSLSLGFGVGTVGVSCLLNPVSMLFPAMMATVFGLSPAIAGYLVSGAKIYDIFADLFIGAASDRSKSRWGRRRPFMLAGGIIGAASFIAIFNPPFTGTALIVFLAVMLVIYSTGYSLFNIPYLAMPAEMTEDRRARTSLISYRTLFISVGQMISVPGAAFLVAHFGRDARGYGVMGWIVGGVVLFTTLLTVFATAKARRAERTEGVDQIKFLGHAKLTLENKPFVLLMSAKFLLAFGLASAGSTQLLFLLNVLGVGFKGQVALGVAMNLAMALALPVWVRLINHFGKRRVFIFALLANSVLIATWMIPDVNAHMGVLMTRGVFAGVLSAAINLAGTSMLPDTMEYDRERTGQRREGVFASVYAIVEKMAFAIAPAILGIYLSVSGYIPTLGGRTVTQPHAAVIAMYVTLVAIPVASDIVAAILLYYYRLGDSHGHARPAKATDAPAATA